ncbi:hypothetical protein ACROYT_G033652 [Oculina patagonica]
MSASPGSASADESGEAVSNKEIWKILKTIQENTDQLLKENKDLKEQYAELRTSLEFHVEKLEKVEKENVNLKTEVTRLQNALNKETDLVSKLGNDLKSTNSNLDDLEQYTRKYNLEFHDFPEEDDENISELIIKLGNLLNVKIAKEFLSAFDSMQDSEDTLMREEEVVKADLKAADELMMPFQQQLSTNKLLM